MHELGRHLRRNTGRRSREHDRVADAFHQRRAGVRDHIRRPLLEHRQRVIELVEREFGGEPRRTGEIGERHDRVEHVRGRRFDTPLHLPAHRLHEMMPMQDGHRRVRGTDHLTDRRFVARQDLVFGCAGRAQRSFERAAHHGDFRFRDAADRHSHDPCRVEGRIGPEERFDGNGGANHLDVDEREAAVVGARVREAPGPPQPHRVLERGARPFGDLGDRQMPIGCQQELDRQGLQSAALGGGVDLLDRRTEADQALDQRLLHLGVARLRRSCVPPYLFPTDLFATHVVTVPVRL